MLSPRGGPRFESRTGCAVGSFSGVALNGGNSKTVPVGYFLALKSELLVIQGSTEFQPIDHARTKGPKRKAHMERRKTGLESQANKALLRKVWRRRWLTRILNRAIVIIFSLFFGGRANSQCVCCRCFCGKRSARFDTGGVWNLALESVWSECLESTTSALWST